MRNGSTGTRSGGRGLRATGPRLSVCATFLALGALTFFASQSASATATTNWAGPSYWDTNGTAHDPRIAMAPNGDGALAWWSGNELWAVSYVPGAFSSEERINTDHEFGYQVLGPQMAVDGNGRIAITWLQMYSDFANATDWAEAWANVFTPGVGWEGEHLLGTANAVIGDQPDVAIGPGGSVYACFLDGGDLNVSFLRCAEFSADRAWQAPHTLANNSTGWLPSYARIAADADGVVIAWDYVDEAYTFSTVWGASYTVAGGWTAPQRLDTAPIEADVSDAKMTPSGARYLLWEHGASGWTVRLLTWTAAGGWDAGVDVVGPDPAILGASVASDAGGNITVVWTVTVNGSTRDLYGRYFSAAAGWTPAALLETVPGRVNTWQVVSDFNGGAIVAYNVLSPGANTTYWARYAPGLGWRAALQIASTGYAVRAVQMDSSPEHALLAWSEAFATSTEIAVYELDRDNAEPVLSFTSAPSLSNTSDVLFEGFGDVDSLLWEDGAPVPINATTGAWSFTVTHTDGSYAVRVIATDIDLNTYTTTLSFVVDTVSHLQIVAPEGGSLETDSLFGGVIGVAEPGAAVTMDGVPITLDSAGRFSELVPLAFGLNRIEIVSVDPAGNRANATVDIRQILNSQDIDEAKAQIANLTANLTAAQADLEEAQAQLAALRASANASQADLAWAQERVNRTLLNVSLMSTELEAAKAQAAASEAHANDAQNAAAGSNTLAIVGIVMGAAGLAVGMLALMRGRKPERPEEAAGQSPQGPEPPR